MTQPTEHTLIDDLITMGQRCVSTGLTHASGGNLSVRLPGSNTFLITASGTWLDALKPESFTVMNLTGEHIRGAENPSSEWKLHQRTYQVRPDVQAIVHAHPQHATLLHALGKPIRFFTLDHAVYVHSIGVAPFHPNGSDELAETAAQAARDHNVVILGNHGCSTMGEDLAMAFRRAIVLEDAAAATYRALTLGDHNTHFPEDPDTELIHA